MDELTVTVERTDAREWSDEQTADLFSDGLMPAVVYDVMYEAHEHLPS